MTRLELKNKLNLLDNYSEEAINAVYDYFCNHYGIDEDFYIEDENAATIAEDDYIEFIYYEDAEKYLKKYWCQGFYSQSLLELVEDIYNNYGVYIFNICDIASYKLEEEISMLLNELY